MLESVQSRSMLLAKDGLFITSYISVLILDKNFSKAINLISEVIKNKISDRLIIANLKKLKGLALMLSGVERSKDAVLKCFEHS